MPGLPLARGAGKRGVRLHKLPYREGGEKRDIHGGEENAVTLVLEVFKPDLGRVEHLGAGIFLIAQEHEAEV